MGAGPTAVSAPRAPGGGVAPQNGHGAGAPLSAAAWLDPAAPSIVPRAIIPAMEEIGLGSGVGSDGGFDLSSAPLHPIEHRFAFEPAAAFAAPAFPPDPPAPTWTPNFAGANRTRPPTLPIPAPTP